jgi:glycosyltransferase involved in cell wall biosynthesis
MKVVHVLPKFSEVVWGGAESVVTSLVRCLEDIDSEVWACRLPGDDRDGTVGHARIRRFWALWPGGRKNIGEGKAGVPPGMVASLVRLSGRDVIVHVHCHNRLAALMVAACRVYGVPVLLTLHSRVLDLRPRLRYWLPNIFPIVAADAVVAVSEDVATQARDVGGRWDVKIVPNGVDLNWLKRGRRERGRSLLRVEESVPVVAFIGRISPIKRVEVLLDALRLFGERVEVTPHLAVVGPAANEAYYVRLRREAEGDPRLSRRVTFLGAVRHGSEELADLYAASDLVVLPSLYEAFGVVVPEAWAAGRAVVVSNVGGASQLVRTGGPGWLWDPATGAAGLAALMAEGIEAVRRDASISVRAAEAAEAYSAGMMAERYRELYRRLASVRRSAA